MPAVFDTHDLIALLADGRFHSGAALAECLGVSRAAVWKRVAKLEACGLEVYRVPGRGYRLADPLELLDPAELNRQVGAAGLGDSVDIEVLGETVSTNAHLAAVKPVPGRAAVALAEYQTAGRGRRGREWVSPYGANLYLSLAWTFASLPQDLTALPLVAAVVAADVLADFGAKMQLKWPNDLHAGGRKLGGVLVELQGEPAGQCVAVIGLGINLRMPLSACDGIDQPWTDLHSLLGADCPGRNQLATAVIAALVRALPDFERDGFASFRSAWGALDLFRDREVVLQGGPRPVRGRAAGIDTDGALLIEQDGRLTRHLSGDVSLRVSG